MLKAIVVLGSTKQPWYKLTNGNTQWAANYACKTLGKIYGTRHVGLLTQPSWTRMSQLLQSNANSLDTFVFLGHGDKTGGMLINDTGVRDLVSPAWIMGLRAPFSVRHVCFYSCYQGS